LYFCVIAARAAIQREMKDFGLRNEQGYKGFGQLAQEVRLHTFKPLMPYQEQD
jgi:hypothetical protein